MVITKNNILNKTRCYLSGPMDFVGSRIIEKYLGWRAILTPILKVLGVRVLDPWNKPLIRGHSNYGKEGVIHSKAEFEKDFWTNKETRAKFETQFWETVHIDLRMTDLSDFLIAFAPTNIYSVGTVHEIVMARTQWKPALVVSPPIKYEFFPEIAALPEETKKVLKFYGLKENPQGIPSQWYGNIVGGQNFFDGFGWESLKFKSSDFYEKLVDKVMELSKPQNNDSEEIEIWEKVKNWVEETDIASQIKGGVLDNIKIEPGEEGYLEEALNNPVEQKREYFWYNTPYNPKRPLLFHLFSVASGYIPHKLTLIPYLDEEGNVKYQSYKSTDDSWLLLSGD